MTLHFHSPNEFPLEVLSILGLSAKLEPHSIGRFGTGLKYGVAVILRLGGSITLIRDGAEFTFRTEAATLRDQPYEKIIMTSPSGEETLLPFTTQYGRDWAPWMAYRELYSNCLDERGGVSTHHHPARTVFRVEGLDEVHAMREEIFPDFSKQHPGDSGFSYLVKPAARVYFQGIRAGDLPQPLALTINFTQGQLTENRTLEDTQGAFFRVGRWAVQECTDPATLRAFIECPTLPDMAYIRWLSNPSAEFCAAVDAASHPNTTCLEVVAKHRKATAPILTCTPTRNEEEVIMRALAVVREFYPSASRDEINVAQELSRAWGLHIRKDGRDFIYIKRAAIAEGVSHLAATLREEFIHAREGLDDETRGLQEHLLKLVINLQMLRM